MIAHCNEGTVSIFKMRFEIESIFSIDKFRKANYEKSRRESCD